MISDDIRGVARHLEILADGRGRLRMNADTSRAVLSWLHTVAEQVATFERNATALEALPVPADDPVKLIRELGRLAHKARALSADAERWEDGPLGRAEAGRINQGIDEAAIHLGRLLSEIERRAHYEDSRARASGAEVVSLADRRPSRAVAPARQPGPTGGAA